MSEHKNNKKSNRLILICTVISVAAIVFTIKGIGRIVSNLTATEPTAVTVNVAGQNIEIDTEIETNVYSAEDFYKDDNGRVRYKGDGVSYGIDVSRHQGNIDWKAAAKDGVDFAIIRVGFRGSGSGTLNTDDRFTENVKGAVSAGIDVGVYFYSQAITEAEALEEAEYVLNIIDGYDIKYPVFFDWEQPEDETARSFNIDYSEITAFAKVFCERIEKAGYKSGIYFNSVQGYLHYDLSDFEDTCLWLAEYDAKPDFYYNFHMWQYSNTGSVAGIDGAVDLNIFLENK